MAADGQGGIIMFGGPGMGDTWRYYQGQWAQLFPATTPPARRNHAMVYTGQSVLMFGGFGGWPSGFLNDTWEWNGSNWLQRFPANAPSPRGSHGMAYDPVRSRVVLHSGSFTSFFPPGLPLEDTWEWDGANWQQMQPANSPQDLNAAYLAFAPSVGRVVSYGGFIPDGTGTNIIATGGCWTWDGNDWVQVVSSQPNPGVRASQIAWSALSGGVLLFSGHAAPSNDTWLTSLSSSLASFASFGSGCVGPTAQAPLLTGVATEPPRVGATARMRASNLPLAVTVPIFALGLSNTHDQGPPAYPLPLDLGLVGWPGCAQLVSDDVISFAITTSGIADYALAVPMNLVLVGFTFHAQALVLYSPSGVAASNGVTGIVGF
jgi:hypothetical protein